MATSASISDPAASASLPQHILTLFGLYARDEDNWLSIGSVITLMGGLGCAPQLVRSSISRMKRRGVLTSEQRDGIAGYQLSPATLRVLEEGDARIFSSTRGTREDGWVLAVFSVPETERDRRYALRSNLQRLGFGVAAPGVWIAPAHLMMATRDTLADRGLDGFVDLFAARYESSRELRSEVATWWDLDELAALYDAFLVRYQGAASASTAVDEAAAFQLYIPALTEWRRLPYRDPGIPLELLPDGWKGEEATALFHDLDRVLRPMAAVHARLVVSGQACLR